jgi:AcrR family transcriptional regulator
MKRTGRNPEETRERILRSFLEVAVQEGLAAATTRRVAAHAGVSEVTLFRHFGGKAELARRAVRHFSPAPAIDAWEPEEGVSSEAAAMRTLVAALGFLAETLATHREVVRLGLAEAHRVPDLNEELAAGPRAAERLLRRTLTAVRPALRPDIDEETTVLMWLGLLIASELLAERGALPRRGPDAREAFFARAVAPFLRRGG